MIPAADDPVAEAIFDALGDPTRRAILLLLAERPRHVTELAGLLPVSRPAVSQGLRVLRDCRFVMAHRQGTRRLYRIDPAGVAAAHGYLNRFHQGLKGTEQ